jgi:hypothetical protein
MKIEEEGLTAMKEILKHMRAGEVAPEPRITKESINIGTVIPCKEGEDPNAHIDEGGGYWLKCNGQEFPSNRFPELSVLLKSDRAPYLVPTNQGIQFFIKAAKSGYSKEENEFLRKVSEDICDNEAFKKGLTAKINEEFKKASFEVNGQLAHEAFLRQVGSWPQQFKELIVKIVTYKSMPQLMRELSCVKTSLEGKRNEEEAWAKFKEAMLLLADTLENT